MAQTDEDFSVKQLLRQRLFEVRKGGGVVCEPPPSARHAVKVLSDLLERTVLHGEGNSLLVIGNRGVGKTWVLQQALLSLSANKRAAHNYITVHLNGLIHTDDRSALLSIARQIDVEESLGDKLMLSFAAALSSILDLLRSGSTKEQSVIFVLEEFDLFAHHKNQTLLYNLFDVSQSAVTPVAVIGLSCRLDVVELLEKRVKSRFSHRQIHLFPDYSFEGYCQLCTTLLSVPEEKGRGKGKKSGSSRRWNDHIQELIKDQSVRAVLRVQFDQSPDIASLKTLLAYPVCKLGHLSDLLLPVHFKEASQLTNHTANGKSSLLQGLSVLELCLIAAMKHVCELNDGEPFNFEMVYNVYNQFAKHKTHSVEFFSKPVTLKAFERLISLELVCPVSDSSSSSCRIQKEYQLVRLMLDSADILDCVKNYRNCPTDLFYWATGSAVA